MHDLSKGLRRVAKNFKKNLRRVLRSGLIPKIGVLLGLAQSPDDRRFHATNAFVSVIGRWRPVFGHNDGLIQESVQGVGALRLCVVQCLF